MGILTPYSAIWVNIYTIFTYTHTYCVNIYLYMMWVNIYTIFTQYLPKYVKKWGKILHILFYRVNYYTIYFFPNYFTMCVMIVLFKGIALSVNNFINFDKIKNYYLICETQPPASIALAE